MNRRFELLTIDTEGNELDVLRSLDLGEFLPRVVAVEVHGFRIRQASSFPIHALLADFGYEAVAVVGPTVFFMS